MGVCGGIGVYLVGVFCLRWCGCGVRDPEGRKSLRGGRWWGLYPHMEVMSNMIRVSRMFMFVCFCWGVFETACMFGGGFGAMCGVLGAV